MVPFFLTALFGLAVGSFLNVVAVRLPAGQSLRGRSRCPHCRGMIRWYENIPVLSFVWLGGRCASCRRPISWQYPAVELATAVLYLLVALKYSAVGGFVIDAPSVIHNSLFILRDWFFIATLIIIFVIDLRHYLILDVVTVPAAVVALGVNLALGQAWAELVLGGILGAGFFALQYVLSRGRWIGDGDIRLGLLLGVMLGWPSVAVALFVAYGTGAIAGVTLLATGKKQLGAQLPFGTFLSLGGAVALLYGEALIKWYLELVGIT